MKLGFLVSTVAAQGLLDINWTALKNQRGDSTSTCAARVNRRKQFHNDPIYHMCMMDTDLYLAEYNPGGTSVFSYDKIAALVSIYGDVSNDLVFGYPTPNCGCFPGCDDFIVSNPNGDSDHLTDFCCNDWEAECVSRDAIAAAVADAEAFFTTFPDPSRIIRKLGRFTTKIQRNLDDDGNVNCEMANSRSHNPNRPENTIDPKISHVISDRFWHIVDHYFRDCGMAHHHYNRVNRFGNGIRRAVKQQLS